MQFANPIFNDYILMAFVCYALFLLKPAILSYFLELPPYRLDAFRKIIFPLCAEARRLVRIARTFAWILCQNI